MTYTFDALKSEYRSMWDSMQLTRPGPTWTQCKAIITGKARYSHVQARSGVPWFVTGILHARESGSPPDWLACLQNGERIISTGRKTMLVPAGRGPFGTWEDAAMDALELDGLEQIPWNDGWGPEHVAFALESFNGFGYRKYHDIPSPYLWGSTSKQMPGKYIQDGLFDSTVLDTQIGGMALLWELVRMDNSITFAASPPPNVGGRLVPGETYPDGEQELRQLLAGPGGIFQRGKAY